VLNSFLTTFYQVGNIFHIKYELKLPKVFWGLLLLILADSIPKILGQQNLLAVDIPIRELIAGALLMSFLPLAAKNWRIIRILGNFRFSTLFTIFGVALELLILCGILQLTTSFILKIVLAFFWIISAIIRLLIETTPTIFIEDIDTLKILLKLYGYTRLLYFTVAFFIFGSAIQALAFIIFFFPAFIVMIQYMKNLVPYINSSKDLILALNSLKLLEKEKGEISIKNLRNNLQASEESITRVVESLENSKFIEVRGDWIYLPPAIAKTRFGITLS